MLNVLKFSGPEDSFFFVSDFHKGHDRDFIYKKRGFSSVTEHDEGLIKTWNERCDNKSIVFHLGDLIFSDPTGKEFWNLLRRLNFSRLYLLLGNHTSGQRQAYTNCLSQQFPFLNDINKGHYFNVYPLHHSFEGREIVFLPQYVDLTINNNQIVLCHYPIISHNHLQKHSIHLCGHSHSGCEITNKDTGAGKRLDVGIESFGGPVSLPSVINHLKIAQ